MSGQPTRILVFGGTTEGRELAQALSVEKGVAVSVSVATPLGAEELAGLEGVPVLVGRLDQPAMEAVMASFDLCIDATHPYASEATRTIAAACEHTGTPLRRLLRAPGPWENGDDVVSVGSCAEAAAFLAQREGRVLLTTGSKELGAFAGLAAADPTRVYARVLPTHEALEACEALGLPHRNVLALQGPFSRAMNEAMLAQHGIAWLVTKDGGAPGGLGEKIAAARACSARTVLVARPPDAGVAMDEVLAWVRTQVADGGVPRPANPASAGDAPRRDDDPAPKAMPSHRTATLVAMGPGGPGALTAAARDALMRATCATGASRLLDDAAARGLLPQGCARHAAVRPPEIAGILAAEGGEHPCVLLSGDTGFYSGARRLVAELGGRGWQVEVLPGVSSMQVLAARLRRPWQDWQLVSAHGMDCNPVAAVGVGRPAFFLTGGACTPATLCAELVAAGLGFLPVVAAQNLTYPDERLVEGTAADLACQEFAPLSVLLVEAAPRLAPRTAGLPDDAFERAPGIPMTKQEVRAAALDKLAAAPGDVCWDVGCGTGSVGVELALQGCPTWGVEYKPEALGLARRNREALGAWNLRLVEGRAPEALAGLPQPDAVFVGGSGGGLEQILHAAHAANPRTRVCVAAIALETLQRATACLEELGRPFEVCQVAVARTRSAGSLHLLMAQNPVFLVATTGGDAGEDVEGGLR